MAEVEKADESDGDNNTDFCRVCRSGATSTQALFYPCLCTGSIKYVHQECLMQWLKHSKREFCELCKHKFAFAPIYSADMPARLPIAIILNGLLTSVRRAVYSWFHYSLVAIAWLLVVPLTACRICRSLFTGSVSSLLTLPLDMLSTENILIDSLYGIIVVGLTLGTFVCFMWVREQIMTNGGPEWLGLNRHEQHADGMNQNGAVQQNENNAAANILGAGNIIPHLFNVFGENADENVELNEQELQNGLDDINPNEQLEIHEEVDVENNENDNQVDVPEAEVENVHNQPEINNNNNNNNPQAIRGQVGGIGPNFNLEWGRGGADELTWEKLIGLDGTLFFLEHVFWIVSLNTLFILVFAFCPYHIGHFTVTGFKLSKFIAWTKIEGVVITIIGYMIIAAGLLVLHHLLKCTKFKYLEKPCHLTGLAFIIIKVALLTILEIGVVPLLCGVWIDVCSLSMFNSTLVQRHNLFQHAPITFIFMHWTVGIMYLFYFASFLLLLKEMLRPGVLWFLKNFNDPNFNPIHDMINQSIPRFVKRFSINCSIFAIIIFMMVWIPNKIIRMSIPGFLPYKFQSSRLSKDSRDSPMDYSLEILFLQVVLPILFDGHTVFWLKSIIWFWCVSVSNFLDLRSFLLGDVTFKPGDIIMNYGGDLKRVTTNQTDLEEPYDSAQHLLNFMNSNHLAMQGPNGNYRPYRLPYPKSHKRGKPNPIPTNQNDSSNSTNKNSSQNQPTNHNELPFDKSNKDHDFQQIKSHFHSKFMILIILSLVSIVVFSTVILTVPVLLGRFILSVFNIDIYCDLISLLVGLFTVALVTKASYSFYQKLISGEGGIRRFKNRFLSGLLIIWKLCVLFAVLFVWIPIVLGLLMNLCLLYPLRVPIHKSLILSVWENWMFGMMHLKIWIMLLLFGPRWWFRDRLELFEQELARREQFRLYQLFKHTGPIIAVATLAVTAPFVAVKTLAPLLQFDEHYLLRRIYPTMFILSLLVALVWLQFKQLHRLYEHIKNERYLVGQQLVNYER